VLSRDSNIAGPGQFLSYLKMALIHVKGKAYTDGKYFTMEWKAFQREKKTLHSLAKILFQYHLMQV